MIPTIVAPNPQPLPACGEGRQSVALAGWGSWGFISNQADMILYHVRSKTYHLDRSSCWGQGAGGKRLFRFLHRSGNHK